MLIAIDTGGTKTLISSFNKDGSIGTTIRFATPVNPSEYTSLLRATLQKHFTDSDVEVIVLALPAVIEDGATRWFSNLNWGPYDAKKALEGVLGDVPLLVENDANLAGLSEARAIEPTPALSLYVTVSTGIGAGVVTNGKIDPGMRRTEAGHMMLEHNGKLKKWESFASGKAIYKSYGKFARDINSSKDWKEISELISRGFLVLIPVIQPDVIVIGGSIGTYFAKYGKFLEDAIKAKLPPHFECPPIIQAKHPEEAVIYGCYYYALDYLASR